MVLKIYGYKSDQLSEFKLENIEILIKNKQFENKVIKSSLPTKGININECN